MNRMERKRAHVLYFTCKKSQEYLFSLRKMSKACSKDFTSSMCFCGSGGCQSLPKIVDNGRNRNIADLFFQLESNADISPVFKINFSRSEIFLPAQGQKQDGRFAGFCKVCQEIYQDYNQHLKITAHLQKIAKNERNQWIIEVCAEVKPKILEGIQKRKKDKYANKIGKTKKLKYNCRNTKTGKFEKKFEQ